MSSDQLQVYTLTSDTVALEMINYGARTTALKVLSHGQWRSVILALPDHRDYCIDSVSLGAMVGPVGGRIENSYCCIDEMAVHLEPNDGDHQLHGGESGIGQLYWDVEACEQGLDFSLQLPEGHGGYPAGLALTCSVRLIENGLSYTVNARCTAPTLVNVTQHNYYCLGPAGSLPDHQLSLYVEDGYEVDSDRVATSTSFGLQQDGFKPDSDALVSDWLATHRRRLAELGGFDHYFYRSTSAMIQSEPSVIGSLTYDGLTLSISTDQPGVQVYTRFGEDDILEAICLEPQVVPNAINRDCLEDTILRPEQRYQWRSILKFSDHD